MEIRTIGIVGAGQMGSGIAQVAAQLGGFNVIINDIAEEFVERGFSAINTNLSRLVEKGNCQQRIRMELWVGWRGVYHWPIWPKPILSSKQPQSGKI